MERGGGAAAGIRASGASIGQRPAPGATLLSSLSLQGLQPAPTCGKLSPTFGGNALAIAERLAVLGSVSNPSTAAGDAEADEDASACPGELESELGGDACPLAEIVQLRSEVRDAADDFCTARRQLGQTLRRRRSLRRQLQALEQANGVAEAALRAGQEECRRWTSLELPAMLARLGSGEGSAGAEASAEAEALSPEEQELEAERLRRHSSLQSRHLEALALRCCALESRARRLDGGGGGGRRMASVPPSPLTPSSPALWWLDSLQGNRGAGGGTSGDRLAELERLQLAVLRERAEHQREVQALQAELESLHVGVGACRAG